jgi:hypothetical protein
MKKFLLLTLTSVVLNGAVPLPTTFYQTASSSSGTNLYIETFDNTGGNGFDVLGTVTLGTTAPDPNYATAPAPISGTQSARLTDAGTDASFTNSFTAVDKIQAEYKIIYLTNYTSTRDGLNIYDTAGNRAAWSRIDGTGGSNRLNLTVLGVGNFAGPWLVVTNQTNYIKIIVEKGTGADAITALWITNVPNAFAAAANISNAAGTLTNQLSSFAFAEEERTAILDDLFIYQRP